MSMNTQQTAILKGADAALKRAARRAREISARTRTPLVTYKDGQVQKRMIVRESSSAESDL